MVNMLRVLLLVILLLHLATGLVTVQRLAGLALGLVRRGEVLADRGRHADALGCLRVVRDHFHEIVLLLTDRRHHAPPAAAARRPACARSGAGRANRGPAGNGPPRLPPRPPSA